MKNLIFIICMTLPVLAFPQTEKTLAISPKGKTMDMEGVKFLHYLTNDSISAEANQRVALADGDTVIAVYQRPSVTYSGFTRNYWDNRVYGALRDGKVTTWKKEGPATSFAWSLILLFVSMFIPGLYFQRSVERKKYSPLPLILFVLGCCGFVFIDLYFSGLEGALTNFSVAGSFIVSNILYIFVAKEERAENKSPKKLRNIILSAFLLIQFVFSFYLFPGTEMLFYVALTGVVLGLLFGKVIWGNLLKRKFRRMSSKLIPL